MKKLIKNNPVKAQKISLVIFVLLMCLNGFISYIFNSLLCAFLIPLVAIIQIVKVTNYAEFCKKEELTVQAEELLKSLENLKNKNSEVVSDVEYEDKTE